MSFSVVGSVSHLIAEYRRFLLRTCRLADPRLREQFASAAAPPAAAQKSEI